jgi:hypothetical protein
MDQPDKFRFAQALIAMGEMYGKELTAPMTQMYFDDLSEFSLEKVLAAMTAHRKDSDRGRWFPKVADLIDKLETKNVTYKTSRHPALMAERSRGLIAHQEKDASVWERIGYASEADYHAGRGHVR